MDRFLEKYISEPEKYKELNSNYKRRIFISTNVAESSLTINGIIYVIDSGLEMSVKYDPVKKRRTDTTSYSKLRHCLNCGHIVHRDQNASRNIKMIFECILNGEVKPQPFCNTFKELEGFNY